MKTRRFGITILLLSMLFLATIPARAKGPPEKITIDGPDLNTEIEEQDPSVLESLAMGRLENLENPIDPPELAGPVYLITRYYRDVSYIPFDRLLYVPQPEGKVGVVYYLGIHNGYGPYDGEWYLVSESGERVLLSLLGERGAPQVKVYGETASSSFSDRNWGLGAIVLLFGVLLTGGLIAQARTQEQ